MTDPIQLAAVVGRLIYGRGGHREKQPPPDWGKGGG
jgi:hypothetical protein